MPYHYNYLKDMIAMTKIGKKNQGRLPEKIDKIVKVKVTKVSIVIHISHKYR